MIAMLYFIVAVLVSPFKSRSGLRQRTLAQILSDCIAAEPPSQGRSTFLHNHMLEVAAMDSFVVPTIGFDLLYAFIITRLDRRDLIEIVTMARHIDGALGRYRPT
jgi:hypothetical protein